MGCSQTDAISAWNNFTLTGPASGKYTSAYLTVTQSDGTAIAGWTNVAITGSRIIDLSSLTAAQSGQQPIFKVHFNGRTGSSPADDAKATVTATGAEPELCITPDIHYYCPTTLGTVTSLAAQSVSLSADGTVTLPNTTVVSLTSASTNVSLSTPSVASCSSNLTGTAAGAGGGRGVPGVTVTLLDGSGNPVYQPNSSWLTTTVTDSNGNYAFNNLAWGTYSVSFPNASANMTVSSASVATGGSGTTAASAGLAVSNGSTLSSGNNGVINAAYILPPIAPSRTQIGAYNNNVVFNPFAAGPSTQTAGDPLAATASTTSNFTGTAGATRLCSSGQTPNSCTATSVTVANGTYTVNTTTGVITFAPTSGFIGVAPAVTYVVTDAASQKTSAVMTPVLASPTVAVNDNSYGQANLPQSVGPIQNDTVSAGNGLTASTVRLCGISPAQSAPGCTLTTLTVPNEGVYTLNTTTGIVTFMPYPYFFGTGTAVGYQVTDYLAQVVNATITPHVVAGIPANPTLTPTPTPTPTVSPTVTPTPTPSPSQSTGSTTGSTSTEVSAKPDFKAGVENTPVTVTPLGNDPVSAGDPKSIKICDLGTQSSSSCDSTTVAATEGDWKVNANGTVTFVPADGFFGKASIGYRVKDAKGHTVWSYITVTIPEKSGLAYTGAGDQMGLALWMFGLLTAGATLVVASRRRQ
jgi:CshA-type fibril repeat protein